MLLSILIAFALGLIYWKNPSRITKILSYVLAILASLGFAMVSVCIILSSNQIAPSVRYIVYLPLSYPLTMVKVLDSLNHVFAQGVIFLWPRGVPIVGFGYTPTTLFNITFVDMMSLLVVGAINVITVLVFLILFYKKGVQRLPPRVQTELITDDTDVDEGVRQLPTASSQLLIKKAKLTKRNRRLLVCTGLILLLVGALFIILPLRVPQAIIQEEFDFSPDTANRNEVSIPFNFAYAVHVTVSFDNYSASDVRRVWLGSYAGLHTPLFGFTRGGTLTYWVNVTTIEFIFGLENSTLFFIQYTGDEIVGPIESLLFIRSLTVEVYYSGDRFASCNVSIVVYQNLLFVPGLVLVGLAAIPFWSLIGMVWIEYRKERTNLSKPPDVTEN